MTSFSQKISEIYGNSKFWRFDVVLKLDIEVKNWWTYTKQLSPFGGVQLSGGVPKLFSF